MLGHIYYNIVIMVSPSFRVGRADKICYRYLRVYNFYFFFFGFKNFARVVVKADILKTRRRKGLSLMERQRNNTSTAAAAPHTVERGKMCALNCQSFWGRITVITTMTTKEGSVFNRASGFLFRSI